MEIAIKTLLAQTKLAKPPHCHDLLSLFDRLDEDVQAQVGHMLTGLPPIGNGWVEENADVRNILEVGRTKFVDWRYLPEVDAVGGGNPKGLINVMQALWRVCLEYATRGHR